MAQNESFDLAGPAGRLEALLMHPDGEARAAAVVCHAHPLHGGMMHFKVVFRAAKALQAQGAAVLRFNFRGVGRSEGTHDHGRGEQDDARAALDEMGRRYPGLPLLIGGFSFGSSMALHVAASDPRPRAVVVLGFPVAKSPDPDVVRAPAVPRLFVQGEHDEFGSAEALRARVGPLDPPSAFRVVQGADHFFSGHLDALQAEVESWAATRPWEETP